MRDKLRRAIALTAIALGGLATAAVAVGSPAAKPPPKRGTTTVTTVISTTTTVKTTTTTQAPAPPPPPPSADISVTTLAPAAGSLYAGSNVTYTSVVKNSGPNDASDVTLQVELQGATIVAFATASGSCSGSSRLDCALGSLASGASTVVTVTLSPAAGSSAIVDSARAWADQDDPSDSNNQANANATVLPGHAGAPVLATRGGAFQPPLFARHDGGARAVTTSVHIDEPSTIFVQVLDASGKAVPMQPRTLVDYRPALRRHTVIPYVVATAHWVPLTVRIAVPAGGVYRIVVKAVASNGTAASTTIRFAT